MCDARTTLAFLINPFKRTIVKCRHAQCAREVEKGKINYRHATVSSDILRVFTELIQEKFTVLRIQMLLYKRDQWKRNSGRSEKLKHLFSTTSELFSTYKRNMSEISRKKLQLMNLTWNDLTLSYTRAFNIHFELLLLTIYYVNFIYLHYLCKFSFFVNTTCNEKRRAKFSNSFYRISWHIKHPRNTREKLTWDLAVPCFEKFFFNSIFINENITAEDSKAREL